MAHTTETLRHPLTGQTREAPIGVAWTVLFFGCFPPLFRSDWKWAVIMCLAALFTYGLSSLVFMFIYNDLYMKDLMKDGYRKEQA